MYYLSNIFHVYANGSKKANDAMLWTMSKIDYTKLLKRMWYAKNWPNKDVKCVLLEYDYTEWSHVKEGNPNVIERMPNSNVLVHHTLKNPEYLKFMNDFFQFDERKVSVYVRQKIDPDGEPNPHRKQLVLMYAQKWREPEPLDDEYEEESRSVVSNDV